MLRTRAWPSLHSAGGRRARRRPTEMGDAAQRRSSEGECQPVFMNTIDGPRTPPTIHRTQHATRHEPCVSHDGTLRRSATASTRPPRRVRSRACSPRPALCGRWIDTAAEQSSPRSRLRAAVSPGRSRSPQRCATPERGAPSAARPLPPPHPPGQPSLSQRPRRGRSVPPQSPTCPLRRLR